MKRHEEALKSFQKAIEIDPKSVNAWINKGVVLANIERYEEARENIQKAIDLDHKSVNAWISRGDSLRDMRKPLSLAIEPWNLILIILIP
ncbi:MAG: tetratricopeptide repeat protein [Aphanothece sp. CMT-3BRIN-NPC111]|nr:tetratricopeptide repeat protein [Aphanothece sp. CMT-3BRIN-NPC111]